MANFTADQLKAINDSNKDILVSASAGSGKTTVLVERVLQKVLKGESIKNLLIITFTKAAANEMKERIKAEISKRLSQNPDNQFLRTQLLDIDTANISTIDSFCLDVIRRFYYVIDLDPSFSILTDEMQSTLLQEKALTEIEKDHLENNNQDFINFYDNFSGDREVDSAHNLIFDLYHVTMAQPDVNNFLENISKDYDINDRLTTSALWQNYVKPYILSQLNDLNQKLEYFLESSQFQTKELNKVNESFQSFKDSLNYLKAAIENDEDFNKQRELFQSCIFPGKYRKSAKWDEDLLDIYQESKDFKDDTKKLLKFLFAHFYVVEENEQIKILKQGKKIVDTVTKVEKEFIAKFNSLKREQNLIDYTDMEHLACKILTQNTSKSSLAKQYYQDHFSEILVDEYQDVNELQEKIIQSVKKKNKNSLFMVGDVKQSIYGFRQARPQLFLNKYHDYAEGGSTQERIILADNFRSSKTVTTTVNKLFNPILTDKFGGIDYEKEAQLVYGATYYPENVSAASEFIYSDKKDADKAQSEIDENNEYAEIQMVISRIKQLKKENFEVFDVKTGLKRPIRYDDIAILSRTRSDNLQIMQEFAKAELPLFVTDAQNYFQTFELIIIMSYLKIIDNPRQDIPLVAVLRSPIFNFIEPELAKIRINSKNTDYYDAVAAYSSKNDALGKKCKDFLNQLEQLRTFSTNNRISELIWTIYEKTHLLEIVTGLPNGKQRRVNLQALYERATSYETAGFKGLYQFISFIERMRKNQKDLAQPLLGDEASNSVKLMTIHASKGLEFPIVFVVGLGHHYQHQDSSNPYVVDPEVGLGLTIKTKNYRIDSLVKSIAEINKKKQNLEEEARILYVALTRARQKLIMTANITNLDSSFKKWKNELKSTNTLSLASRVNANSPMDFLGPGLVRKNFVEQRISEMSSSLEAQNTIYYFNFLPEKAESSVKKTNVYEELKNEALPKIVQKLYDFKYPFADATKTTAYQAVSEIKSAYNDPLDKDLENSKLIESSNRYLQPIDEVPQFLKQTKFTGAEIGTATHLILQYYDYKGDKNKNNLEKEIQELIAEEKLNPDIVESISKDAIEWFVNSEFTENFWLHPDNLFREQEFSSLLPAHDIFSNFSDKQAKILVHGTIDGYYVDKDGIILFDYKTDFVDKTNEEAAIEKIKQKYQGQLRLYEQALNSFSKEKVKSKYLVLLDAKKLVKLE